MKKFFFPVCVQYSIGRVKVYDNFVRRTKTIKYDESEENNDFKINK